MDGSVESIYCNYDGYLEGVGKLLYEDYSNYERIVKLINLGDILKLNKRLDNIDNKSNNDVTVAYHRDLGEELKNNKPLTNKNISELKDSINDSLIEYIYLYDEKNKMWLWDYNYFNSDFELQPLKDSLIKEDIINGEDYDIGI